MLDPWSWCCCGRRKETCSSGQILWEETEFNKEEWSCSNLGISFHKLLFLERHWTCMSSYLGHRAVVLVYPFIIQPKDLLLAKASFLKIIFFIEVYMTNPQQWWKTESISSKIRNKTRVLILTITIQHSFGSPSYSNQRIKRNKRNPNQRRIKTVTVCRWHDTCRYMAKAS